MSASDRRRSRPNYGVDAPGVVAGLIGGGTVGIAAGTTLRLFAGPGWIGSLGGVSAVASGVPVALGLSMVAYALGGKARLRDHMLDRHDWRGDEVVLDIGAGRGLMAIGAAKRAPEGRAIAVDVWRAGDLTGNGPNALRENAQAEGVADRVEVLTEDASALSLADASVDVVVSVLCLHNIEPVAERTRALDEIVRVLRPGGRMLVADYIGTKDYAGHFRRAGMHVDGPIGVQRFALTSMTLVDARKPAG